MRKLLNALIKKIRRRTKVLIRTCEVVDIPKKSFVIKSRNDIISDFDSELEIEFEIENLYDLHDRFILLVIFLFLKGNSKLVL